MQSTPNHEDLEARKVIPEGALDRFKKQSRAAHGEPLKFLQMLQNALDVGVGVNIDDFRQSQPPSPRVPPHDELGKRHTLILTSDEEPSQTGPEFISTLHMVANHEPTSLHLLPFQSSFLPLGPRIKAMNMLIYNVHLRILRKREEHHRVANDADDAAKQEGLWGTWAHIHSHCFSQFFRVRHKQFFTLLHLC